MSDISGPPLPKPVDPVARTTGKTSNVSKDPQQAQTETREHKGDSSSKNEQVEHLRGREPAVSISATAAHLEVGERLKEQVNKIDNEGRPIIVTETATFALRPDAGLRPGDDVKLEIVEAGHKLAADLHERNGRKIDPPVRLALIVIAIHTRPQAAQTGQQSSNVPLLPEKAGYGPAVQTKYVSQQPPTSLVDVLGRTSPTSSSPLGGGGQAYTPAPEMPFQPPIATSQQTGNPDFLASRNSSQDLATLIAAQQGGQANTAAYFQAGGLETGLPKQLDPTHIIPKSTLTDVNPNALQQGLGPAIRAFSYSGQPHAIQVMDPGKSQVAPAEVASVLSVRPLPPEEAKSLPLPIALLNPSGGTLAAVETSKGNFVVPLAQANNLSGELVKVSELDATPTATQANEQASFKATLAIPGTSQRPQVTVLINKHNAASSNVPGEAQIKAVHTVRAFLTPKGPSTDFRIETSRGDVFVTMPNSFRPTTDDWIQIVPHQAAVAQNVAPPTMPMDMASQLATGSALSTLGGHYWPTLEQGIASVIGTDPALSSQLASRGAQGGGKLVNSLLFFLNAAGRGSPEAWLGQDAARALEQSNKTLFDSLKSEMTRLMQATTDTSREWRPVLLPLDLRFPDMPIVAMLFGPPPRDESPGDSRSGSGAEEDAGKDAQRFLLEVQFSVLGAIQLDGLIKENRFDLALRSEKPLSTNLRREASDLFNSALAANGYNGQLTITEAKPFPVEIEALLQQG